MEKRGSPIFTLCQNTMPHFKPHLTWVPRNGKKINIWQDSIMGDSPLGMRQDLVQLKEWMDTQKLFSLWDISIWGNDEHKMWLGWGMGNYPSGLEEEWNILKLCLQGKFPLKKRGKDKRGWGVSSGFYTTAAGYQLTNANPNVPSNPAI